MLGCKDGQLRLVDLASGRDIRCVGDAAKPPAKTTAAALRANRAPLFAVSPDGRTIGIRNTTDNSVRLWEVATNQERARFHGRGRPVMGRVVAYNQSTPRTRAMMRTGQYIVGQRFSPGCH